MSFEITNSKIQTFLPAVPPDTIPPELYGAFLTIYNAIQLLQSGISQYSGIDPQSPDTRPFLVYADTLLEANLTRMYPIASVPILRGQVVNLFNNAGALNARLAIATAAATKAHGIANEAAAPGQQFEMNLGRGCLDSIVGLALGSEYYLSTVVAGSMQTARPAAAGQIIQNLGLALSTTSFHMNISPLHIQL